MRDFDQKLLFEFASMIDALHEAMPYFFIRNMVTRLAGFYLRTARQIA